MKKLFPFLLILVSAVAAAATLTATWTNPIQNEDGTSIPATGAGSISSTRIEYGSCSGAAFGTKSGEVTVQGAATTAALPNLGPGTWCARAYTTNTYGQESSASNVSSKTIAAPTPKPPTGFTIG